MSRFLCAGGAPYVTYESALKSRKNEIWGAHAFRCSACSAWHAQPNVARDWAKQPLGSKSGPKPKNSMSAALEKDEDD